jgi:dimethylhistidine N-methyltransferase
MTIAEYEFIKIQQANSEQHQQLVAGLLSPSAFISPKYFYDALGSKLFAAICEVQEYYPTRTEAAIFQQHLKEIAESIGVGSTFVDLGAGNCEKAVSLFSALQPSQYVAVDISTEFLRNSVSQIQQKFPSIPMLSLGMDFSTSLQLPDEVQRSKRVFFYPGSTIGNFTPEEALAFFKRICVAGGSDGSLLIGVDLVKDVAILNAAYNDALGVTASFNLNVLLHLNKILGANFEISSWCHKSFFNVEASRIEMYLEATSTQLVKWPGGERLFAEGERIHTENSYKYTVEGFVDLLQRAGMKVNHTWHDENNWFLVCHASMA